MPREGRHALAAVDGTDDPTMCKLMDSVLAGHGFGMFVLGMLCGLACAFCAYLFITRCRSHAANSSTSAPSSPSGMVPSPLLPAPAEELSISLFHRLPNGGRVVPNQVPQD